MDSSKPSDATKAVPVEIDYDHINVAELMARIQKSAAEAPPAVIAEAEGPGKAAPIESEDAQDNAAEAPREASPSSISPIPAAPASPLPAPPEPQGLKQKIKKIVRVLMRPFFPLIRFLAFPIHEELRATIKSLHETNIRLDNLYPLFDMQAQKFDRSLERLEVNSDRNVQNLEVRLDQGLHGVEQRLDIAGDRTGRGEVRLDLLEERIKDLDKSMEYIRLLHNLDHNLVVELTKLKVEVETLKSKFRILEKDQEIGARRERALEERVLK